MAYDSVLDREMFRPKSRGVVSLDDTETPEISEDLRNRREQAMAMMNAAKEKFDPKNFQTLKEQDRPGVFRPVAVNMPAQQQTADTAQRMQQMAAQGVRPVGFEEGGLATVKQWIESGFGLENVIPGLKELRQRNSERLSPTVSSPELTENAPEDSDLPTPAELNMDRPLTDEEKENIRRSRTIFETFTTLGPAVKVIKSLDKTERPRPTAPAKTTSKPSEPEFVGPTLPKSGDAEFVGPTYPTPPRTSVPQVPQRPPGQLPPRPAGLVDRAASSTAQNTYLGQQVADDSEPTFGGPSRRLHGAPKMPTPEPSAETKKPAVDKNDEDKHPTGIESIKAERARQREENFNMALIRAGLGMAAGKSSNALANIGEGGIAGLEQFARAEKEDRAFAAEEAKYKEDRESRLQRAAESLQEKQLTRETRILDIKSDENSRIDDAVGRLREEYSKAIGDKDAQNEIKYQISRLEAQKFKNQRIIQSTLGKLGYEGEGMYSSAPAIGSIITQNGAQYRVTGVDKNGNVTAADPVD